MVCRRDPDQDVLPFCRAAGSRPRQVPGPFVVEKQEAGVERYGAGGLGVSLRVTVTACARGHALPTCLPARQHRATATH